jgi:hypothetical protein
MSGAKPKLGFVIGVVRLLPCAHFSFSDNHRHEYCRKLQTVGGLRGTFIFQDDTPEYS